MRVVVPYAVLRPETRAALAATGREPEYVWVGDRPEAYHDLLEQVWREGRGFIVVEHDIVVRPDTLDLLEACPEPWCGFAYSLSTGYGSYLGCAKFADALVAGNSAFDWIAQARPDGTPRRYWGRLDTRLATALHDHAGLTIHVHWPAVGHLNPAQQPPFVHRSGCGHRIPDEVVRQGPGAVREWRCC